VRKKLGLSFIARLSVALLILISIPLRPSSYGMEQASSTPMIMLLILHRDYHSKHGTFGVLTGSNNGPLFTLEETEYEIPSGRYPIEMTYSPHFRRYLPLLIVPNRQAIRLHEGNWPRDSSGCILLGLTRGRGMILQSRAALDPLVIQIRQALDSHEPVWLEIS
jgi:hypothetical protein